MTKGFKKISCQDQGLEPVTALRLAFQSDALPTELSLPLYIIMFLSGMVDSLLV